MAEVATKVRVERVLRLCDPRIQWPWPCDAPTAEDVEALLKSAREMDQPVQGDGSAAEHLGRVRYLARHGWTDAIELDVGVPALGYEGPGWPVTDGNHRLWAACLRGDEWILVGIQGQVDHAARLLGVTEAQVIGSRSELAVEA